MNQQRLNSFTDRIAHLVSARRLNAAMGILGQLLDEIIAPWELKERLSSLRESYKYLTRYALDGTPDPHREEVYANITNGIDDLVLLATRIVKATEDSSLYFSTLRYEQFQKNDNLPALLELYKNEASILEMASLADNMSPRAIELRNNLEKLEKRIFNRIWVTYPLSAEDESAISSFMSNDLIDPSARALLISALLLALLTNYDERAMYLLAEAYNNSTNDLMLRMRALVALLISFSFHRNRVPAKRLRQLLDTLRDSQTWDEDVKMVFLQFIRTRDTEKINRKMQDEVIPQILKLRPDIYKKISENPESLDIASMEENPEWEDLLEKSGLTDKMRQLQEMQEDGGDVLMGTFSHLKTFPFFSDISNWFLPFRPTHSAVAGTGKIGEVLAAAPFMCNSDKYSALLSVAQMPGSQRDMLTSQFDMQNINMREIEEASLGSPAAEREKEVSKYVQDLYRFFKLFRRKGEFNDPFNTPLNLATVQQLSDIFDNTEHLSMVAEFYFRRGYYDDALALFKRLESSETPSIQLYQKMGYAVQKSGDTKGALDYYLKAELLNPDDPWTLKRIASCYRVNGDPAKALEYYQHLSMLKPDDLTTTLHTGYCLMELDRYDEALKQYFKVEFLDEKSRKALRPIAWCSFLAGDYSRSRDYYNRLSEKSLSAGDYLNMGHLEMATGNYHDAVDRYNLALDALKGDTSQFATMMQSDLKYLRKAGVPDFMTGVVLDTILSQ